MTSVDPTADIEAATKRVQALSQQVADQAKKNGLVWVEAYEKVLKNMLDLEEQAAKESGVEWAQTLAATHANFVRDTSEAILSTVTQQLKS